MENPEQSFSELFLQVVMPEVQLAFNSLFAAADQAILQLARSAKDNNEQNRFYEAAQNLRIIRFQVLDAFAEYLINPPDIEPEQQQRADSLQVFLTVKPQEYQANTVLLAAVNDYEKRLQSLAVNNRALMPEEFTQYFLLALTQANLDVHTKMLVLRLFELYLYNSLTNFVSNFNEALKDQGVLPDLHTDTGLSHSADAIVNKTLSKSEPEVQLVLSDSVWARALDELQADDVELLWSILDSDNVAEQWRQFLIHRDILEQLDRDELANLACSDRERLLAKHIPLAGKIFEQMRLQENLSELAKAMLSALFLPYTRIAVIDESFFIHDKHPARLILSELIDLASNWQPDMASLGDDSCYRLLLFVVQGFIEAERLSDIPYPELQLEILAYRESRREKLTDKSQHYVDSEYKAQMTQRGREDVLRLIKHRLQGKQLPFIVQKFITEIWSNVLYVEAMDAGTHSEKWLGRVAVLDALIESFKPPELFEGRDELLLSLPALLRALHQGLNRIDMPTADMNQWFAELEQEHKQLAINIGGVLDENPVDLMQRSDKELKFDPEEMKNLHMNIDHADQSSESSVLEPSAKVEINEQQEHDKEARYQLLLDNITQGVWFDWHRPKGTIRCQLAAIIKHMNKYIIVDRNGAKITDLLDRELINKLKTQEIEVVRSGAVFDKTLASVIGDIQDGR